MMDLEVLLSQSHFQQVVEEGGEILSGWATESAEKAEIERCGGESSFPGESFDGDNVLEAVVAGGVQIARIVMHVAGRLCNVPKKIMPDDDDFSRFVLVPRAPETGEMVSSL